MCNKLCFIFKTRRDITYFICLFLHRQYTELIIKMVKSDVRMGNSGSEQDWEGDFSLYIILYCFILEPHECITFKNKN